MSEAACVCVLRSEIMYRGVVCMSALNTTVFFFVVFMNTSMRTSPQTKPRELSPVVWFNTTEKAKVLASKVTLVHFV